MDILYAPWRDLYVRGTKDEKSSACVFCDIIADVTNDAGYFVLKRTAHTITLMNLFPYNSGHLLILPIAHVQDIAQVSYEAGAQMMYLAGQAQLIAARVSNSSGANVGINLGAVAGAGLPQHLHMHFVPRFAGDTNFLPILAGTKQISVDLQKMYEKLKIEFDALKI